MICIDSMRLLQAAQTIRENQWEYGRFKEGVRASAEQCEKAAELLQDAEPSIITGIRGTTSGTVNFQPQERPGFIAAEQQDDPQVLVFTVGIIPSTTYRIDRQGRVLSSVV